MSPADPHSAQGWASLQSVNIPTKRSVVAAINHTAEEALKMQKGDGKVHTT